MIAEELLIQIRADTKKARRELKGMEQRSEKAEKSFSNMAKNVAKRGAAFGAAAVSIGAVTKAIGDSVKAYKEQEQAEKALSSAAERNPLLDEQSVTNIERFASELQNVSTIGDETAIRLASVAASSGRSEKEIKDMTQAAADVSAAMGITMESAMRSLNKSFGGMTGELGELVPELQNLSEEQLEAGEGVDLIREKFDGAAKAMGDTATGELQQLNNSFGDLKEEMGEAILDGVQPLTKSLGNLVTEAVDAVGAMNDLSDVTNTFTGAVDTDAVESMGLTELEEKLESARDRMDSLYQRGTDGARRQAEQIRNDVIPALEERIAAAEEEQEKAETRNEIIGKYEEMARRATQLSEQRAKEEKKAADQMERQKKLAREAFNERFEGMEQYVEAQKSELQQLKEKKELWESMQFTEDQEYQLQIKKKALDLLEEEISKLERQKEEKQESNEVEGEGKNILSEMRDISAEWHSERMAQIQEEIDRMEALHEKYGAIAPEVKRIQDAWNKWGEQVYGVTTRTYSALMSLQENQHNQEIQALEEEIQQRKENGKDTTELEKKKQEKINQFRKEQWEREKQGKLLQATISTAQAVAEALPSLALAATVGALGAVQIGAIAATENPYYKGGVIEEPVMGVGQKTGETYSFGERGPETVTPGRNKGQSTRITVNLDRRVILDAVSKGTQNGEVIVDQRAVR